MSKCHHHHHHHHHGHHCEGSMPMEHPGEGYAAHPMREGCGAPPSIPIHGRCVMTPRGPICCVAFPQHRMR